MEKLERLAFENDWKVKRVDGFVIVHIPGRCVTTTDLDAVRDAVGPTYTHTVFQNNYQTICIG